MGAPDEVSTSKDIPVDVRFPASLAEGSWKLTRDAGVTSDSLTKVAYWYAREEGLAKGNQDVRPSEYGAPTPPCDPAKIHFPPTEPFELDVAARPIGFQA